MMDNNTFLLNILTPHSQSLSENVSMFVFNGDDGQIGIMKNHEPLACVIETGIVKLFVNEEVKTAAIEKGMFVFSNNKATVFTPEIMFASDKEELEKDLALIMQKDKASVKQHAETEVQLLKVFSSISDKMKNTKYNN